MKVKIDTLRRKGLIASLIVFLIKNPTCIYMMFYPVYKVLFAVAMIFVCIDMALQLRKKRVTTTLLGVVPMSIFFFLTVVMVMVVMIVSESLELGSTVQFIGNIFQFFLIIYIVFQAKLENKILEWIYRFMVFLGMGAVFLYGCNMVGFAPPSIMVPYLASEASRILFYLPFGVSGYVIPVPIAFFRTNGLFSEPALFAFGLGSFLFYGWYKFRRTKQFRHALASVVLFLGLITTYSVAGFVSLAGTLMIPILGEFILNPKKVVRYVLLLLVICTIVWAVVGAVLNGTRDNVFLFRRLAAVHNRQAQWDVAKQYILTHPIGKGVGVHVETSNVFREDLGVVREYAEPTNILISVYALGYIYVLPLLFLYAHFLKWIFMGFFSRKEELKVLAKMLFFYLIMSFSMQVVFTAAFFTVLSVFLIKLSSYESEIESEHDLHSCKAI